MNKTALITGALGQTGRELCQRFKRLGYYVVATDKENGVCDCHFFIQTDITRLLLKEPPEMFNRVVLNAIGGKSLDLLVLNATLDQKRRFEETTANSLVETLHCNVVAPLVLLKQFRNKIQDSKGIVMFTTSAYRKRNLSERCEYTASKYALTGLVASLGEEFGESIRVYGVGAAPTSLNDKMDFADQFGQRIADAAVRVVEEEDFLPSGHVIYL